MAALAGEPSLAHIIKRLEQVPSIDGIVVATSTAPEDDVICKCAHDRAVPVYRGSAEDVLGRTLAAARLVGAATVVRVCGDCPLTDPAIVETVIAEFERHRVDFASNGLHPHEYPVGVGVEVFPTAVLEQVEREAAGPRYREHVTLFIVEHPERFRLLRVTPPPFARRPDLRLTLDTPSDYELISALYDSLHPADPCFGLDAVLAYLELHPELAAVNGDIEQHTP
jgi:spore coat polysaccharide biosynthesis protein SpsF